MNSNHTCPIRLGVADYGMNVWFGDNYDYRQRMIDLRAIGFDGTERLIAYDAADLMDKLTILRELNMDCATVVGPRPEQSLKWSAALGKTYVWTLVNDKNDFDVHCRKVNDSEDACARYGIRSGIHNHMGTQVETQAQLEEFLKRCPRTGIVLDTGHLAAMGGDALEITQKYFDRICAVHLKNWEETNPGAENWEDRGHFCGLGEGNVRADNRGVVLELVKRGFRGWIDVEHDCHMRNPYEDLKASRELISEWLREAGRPEYYR